MVMTWGWFLALGLPHHMESICWMILIDFVPKVESILNHPNLGLINSLSHGYGCWFHAHFSEIEASSSQF